MPKTPMHSCDRCRAMVPADKSSCPLLSKDTLGDPTPPTSGAQPKPILHQPFILVTMILLGAFWLWGGMVRLKAYDLQAIPVERAKQVHEGMTHREVVDQLGRDAVPIVVWTDFKATSDQLLLAEAESAQTGQNRANKPPCNPDTDDACGAHYPLKDGSGLRLIYQRGIVVYAAISAGAGYNKPRGAP